MKLAETTTTGPSWWSRPGGGRQVLAVSLPLVLSSLSWTILTFIDRIFLAWWSTDALAASLPASLLWWTSLCFPMGTCMYASTFVSQYQGSGEQKWIGPIVWQSVWIGVLATPLVMLIVPVAPLLFEAAGHGPRIQADELSYFRILCVGTPAMLVSYALSSFYSGQGRTWVVMLVDAFSVAVNIVLDYFWIFGYAGFPAAGIQGAAWATVVAVWVKVPIYLALVLARPNRSGYQLGQWAFNRRLAGRLIYFGGPSGLQMLLEVAGFTAFVFLVGRLGDVELAATNMAFNVSSVAFMPVFGLATAASILVGQQLGENQPQRAADAAVTTVWLAVGYMGCISALYVLVPDLFLFGFSAHERVDSNTPIRAIAVVLLRYVAAYNTFDALNMVFASAIKGAGDTHFVFAVSLIMALLLGLGTWIGIRFLQLGLHGCWLLITVWVGLLGLIYLSRFSQGKWRSMRVIDQGSIPLAPSP